MELIEIKYFVESALLAAGRPLNIDQIKGLFDEDSAPEKSELRQAIVDLNEEYADRGVEIREVASGFRMQVKAGMAERLHRLWEEKPPRYSRALFETLALIAYRQPMTRGEIEEVRGVSVSSNIVRSLLEREWVRVVGHRDVPGRPALFGTTKLFLDYFGLKKLEDLPPLADLSDWETLRVQLNLPEVEENAVAVEGADITELAVSSNDDSGEPFDEGDLPEGTDFSQDESAQSECDETSQDENVSFDESEPQVVESESESAAAPQDDASIPDDEIVVQDDPLQEGDSDEAPILQPELDAAGSEGAEVDDGFEEIVATEWPDSVPVVRSEDEAEEALSSDSDIDKTASGV
jgi:segregation and condensation protein B